MVVSGPNGAALAQTSGEPIDADPPAAADSPRLYFDLRFGDINPLVRAHDAVDFSLGVRAGRFWPVVSSLSSRWPGSASIGW